MSRSSKKPEICLTSFSPGAPHRLEFGGAAIVLSNSEHGLISEFLRCCGPDAEDVSIKGDQGWVLTFKCNPRGVRLEVESHDEENSDWSSGESRISYGQAKKLADHLDSLVDDEMDFIQDGASPAP